MELSRRWLADVPCAIVFKASRGEERRASTFPSSVLVLEWRSYLRRERRTAFCRLTILSLLDSDSERGEVEAASLRGGKSLSSARTAAHLFAHVPTPNMYL